MEEDSVTVIGCISYLTVFTCFIQVIFIWGNWNTYNYIFYRNLGELFLYSLIPYLFILFIKLMYNCYVDIIKCHGRHNLDDFIETTVICLKAFIISIMCALLIVYLGKTAMSYCNDFQHSNFYYNLTNFFEGMKGAIK